MTESRCVLRADNLSKRFVQGASEIVVLSGLSFELHAGEQVAVIGRSGSGKSTLMHILAGLDTPDEGSVWIAGVDMVAASNDERAAIRGSSMGFVYQNHHLLPEFTAQENVAMPLRISGVKRVDAEDQAKALLGEVGLGARTAHLPHQLSGGERQRVAVARALAGDPQIILADLKVLGPTDLRQISAEKDRCPLRSHNRCLLLKQDGCLLLRQDKCLLLRSGR